MRRGARACALTRGPWLSAARTESRAGGPFREYSDLRSVVLSGDSSERDFLTGISRLDPKSFVFYSLGYSKSRNSSYWFCATWVEGARFSSLWVDFRDEDNSSRRPGPMGTALFLAQSLHRLDIAGSQRGQQTGGRACSHQRDGHACEGLDVEGLHAVQQRSQQVGEARR